MRVVICTMVLALAVTFGACKQDAAEGVGEPSAAEGAEAPAELEMVEVPAEGQEFDPAVEVAQLPDGVWYCDMGTVHWAQQEEGEGRCPLCKMKLVKKLPQAGDEAAEEGAE